MACFEALRSYQRLALDLVERIFQLGGAIGRVDAHKNGADPRCGELRQHPFDAVRAPDADAVPLADTDRQ